MCSKSSFLMKKTAVQKTLVFWAGLEPLKVNPRLYLAMRAETRYNNQSLERGSFYKFLHPSDPAEGSVVGSRATGLTRASTRAAWLR